MSKPRNDEPLKTPQYKGGMAALKKFITQNLVYPQQALDAKIEGDVEVAYDVDGLGRIKNVMILSGIGHGCDEEVIRLINLLVYQTAINKGKNTLTHKKLKINFKLPAAKPAGLSFNYELKKNLPVTEKPTAVKPTLSYTISIKRKD